MTSQLYGGPHFFIVSILIPFFLELFEAYRLYIIYMREDNDFSV